MSAPLYCATSHCLPGPLAPLPAHAGCSYPFGFQMCVAVDDQQNETQRSRVGPRRAGRLAGTLHPCWVRGETCQQPPAASLAALTGLRHMHMQWWPAQLPGVAAAHDAGAGLPWEGSATSGPRHAHATAAAPDAQPNGALRLCAARHHSLDSLRCLPVSWRVAAASVQALAGMPLGELCLDDAPDESSVCSGRPGPPSGPGRRRTQRCAACASRGLASRQPIRPLLQ